MKKLIIVCEEKLHQYGDFLAQLISSSDDAGGNIVGIKDGAAAAQVWTEAEYAANAPQISSEQYILFIGNSELIKEKRLHMQIKYSEFGMNYGWLGKQGVLFVDRVVSYSEYEEFYKLACHGASETSRPEVTKLIESKNNINEIAAEVPVADIEIDENTAVEEAKVSTPDKGSKLPKFIIPIGEKAKNLGKGTAAFLQKTADFGIKHIDNIRNNMAIASKGKEIEQQEYSCIILMFYLKDLGNFLGLGE